MPHRYPCSFPSVPITRWQGTTSAMGLVAQARATARTDAAIRSRAPRPSRFGFRPRGMLRQRSPDAPLERRALNVDGQIGRHVLRKGDGARSVGDRRERRGRARRDRRGRKLVLERRDAARPDGLPDFDEAQSLGGRGDEHETQRRVDRGPLDRRAEAASAVRRRLHAGQPNGAVETAGRSVAGLVHRTGHAVAVSKVVEEIAGAGRPRRSRAAPGPEPIGTRAESERRLFPLLSRPWSLSSGASGCAATARHARRTRSSAGEPVEGSSGRQRRHGR